METSVCERRNSVGTITPVPTPEATRSALRDKVSIEAEAAALVIILVDEVMAIENLLVHSSKKRFGILEEDQALIDAKSSAQEI